MQSNRFVQSCLVVAALLSTPAILSGCASAGRSATLAVGDATASVFTSDRITVTSVGTGPDVVLIPGLSSSPAVWASTVSALPGYRYHLVKVSGFAGSPAGANANGPVVAPVAGEIARYIREQRLNAPALVGHSMGGSLAMQVAMANPDLVSKVMVVDMMPFMGAMFGPPGATAASVEPVAAQIRTALASSTGAVRRQQTEMAINGMIRTESLRAEAVTDSMNSDANVSAQAMYDLITTDLTADLAKITVPLSVLYVTPTGAPLTDAQMDFYYAAAYRFAPNHTLTRVQNSAHFIMWDQPVLFIEKLGAFLRQ